MLTAHRVLAFLFIGAIAASSADAFKPSVQKTISSNSAAASFLDNPADVGSFVNEVKVIRGGDSEDSCIIKSADVVKAHALAVLLFAAVFFLDTLGGKNMSIRWMYQLSILNPRTLTQLLYHHTIVKIPLMGPGSLIPGYNSGDTAVKYLTRFMCGLWTGMVCITVPFQHNTAHDDDHN